MLIQISAFKHLELHKQLKEQRGLIWQAQFELKQADKLLYDLNLEKEKLIKENKAFIKEIEDSKEINSIALSFILTLLKAIVVKVKCVEVSLTKEEPSVKELVDGIEA